MFEGLKLRRERIELQRAQVRVMTEAVQGSLSRMKRSLDDADANDWVPIGTTAGRGLDVTDSQAMRDQAVRLYYRNSHARGIIRLMEKYICGRGFSIAHDCDLDAVKEWWADFWKLNKMTRRCKEIIRRGMRDGDVAIRKFRQKGTGQLVLRFMDVAKIKEPAQARGGPTGADNSDGIATDPQDIENVLGFWYDEQFVPASEVFFRKILVDSDVKRGRSFLEVVMPDLALYRKWLTDRMKLNYIRSLIGLDKEVRGGPSEVASLAAGYETSKLRAADGSAYHKTPEGVSVVTHNPGVKYSFMTPNLQAGDVQHDGRSVLLSIAAGSGLSEPMVTADASNANYASSLVAEAPAVMEFEDWQDFWRDLFEEIYETCIQYGIRAGVIPEKYEDEQLVEAPDPATGEMIQTKQKVLVDTPTTCDVEYPEIVHREILQETQALALQSAQRWISAHTAAARLNLNYDEELERIRREEKADAEQQGPEDQTEQDYEKARQDAIDGTGDEDEADPEEPVQ